MKGVAKLAPGPGHVAYADRPDVVAGPGEVVIDLLAAGICGTDLHIEAGEYPSVPPVTMGHEFCGVVAELGDGVDPAWLGARVTSETFYSTCGHCRWCRSGRPSICAERRSIGTHVDGAFAPRVRVPARNLHRVPDGLSDRAAAICEPLACVCNSLSDPASVDAGDEVLVIGPGAIGLLAAQVARANGGRVHVRGTAHDEARLELARSLGFETSTADRPFAGEAPDVVVECSGAAPGDRGRARDRHPRRDDRPDGHPRRAGDDARSTRSASRSCACAPASRRIPSRGCAPCACCRRRDPARAADHGSGRARRLRARVRAHRAPPTASSSCSSRSRYWCGPRWNAFVRTRSMTSNVSLGVARPSSSAITASAGQTA